MTRNPNQEQVGRSVRILKEPAKVICSRFLTERNSEVGTADFRTVDGDSVSPPRTPDPQEQAVYHRQAYLVLGGYRSTVDLIVAPDCARRSPPRPVVCSRSVSNTAAKTRRCTPEPATTIRECVPFTERTTVYHALLF